MGKLPIPFILQFDRNEKFELAVGLIARGFMKFPLGASNECHAFSSYLFREPPFSLPIDISRSEDDEWRSEDNTQLLRSSTDGLEELDASAFDPSIDLPIRKSSLASLALILVKADDFEKTPLNKFILCKIISDC